MPQETYEAYHNVVDNYGHAIKLEFRFKTSNSEQFEYSYLVRTSIKLSAGKIIMKYMDAIVTIEGFNLKRLVDDLRHNKVEWIQEAETEFDNTNPSAVFIKRITIEEITN